MTRDAVGNATKPLGSRVLPRELAPGIHWLGSCTVAPMEGHWHVHLSNFLVVGASQSLLVDTGVPSSWPLIERQLDGLLQGKQLDWVFPTHPEFPHSANLRSILEKYPRCRVIGDLRDLHLYRPTYANRFVAAQPGQRLSLGGAAEIVFQEALFKDLPSTLWAYESGQQVMFVADGFGYSHHSEIGSEEAIHTPGECALTSSELVGEISVDQMAFILRAALYWTRYVDVAPAFRRLAQLLEDYPTRLIAPAHGNVVDDVGKILPVIREAHRRVYEGTRN